MEQFNIAMERRKTKKLLRDIVALTIGLPFLSGCMVFLYTRVFTIEWSRKEWRLVILCIWLGTMLGLSREAFKSLEFRRARRHPRYKKQTETVQVTSPRISGWEGRKSRRILHELCIAAVTIPLCSASFVLMFVLLSGAEFTRRDWKTVVFVLWVGTLLTMVRGALNARRQYLVYGTESTHARPEPAEERI